MLTKVSSCAGSSGELLLRWDHRQPAAASQRHHPGAHMAGALSSNVLRTCFELEGFVAFASLGAVAHFTK